MAGNIYSSIRYRQAGGVLIFLLICLAMICILMAFVIDINAYYVRKTQADATAKIVALAALEEYYDLQKTCPNCSKNQRLDRALERAREIANVNLIMADREQLPELADQNQADKAYLEAGIWERRADQCPNNQAPCFIKVERSGNQHPNAFRVSGRLFPEGSKNFFSDTFLDMFSIGITVEAVSSMVPRKGCFLVDISASTTRDTHKEFIQIIAQPDGSFREEGYQCSVPPDGVKCCPNLVNGGFEYAEFAYDAGLSGVTIASAPIVKAWSCMQNTANRSGNLDPSLHFRSDYVSKNLLTDADFDTVFAKYHPAPYGGTTGFSHHFDRTPQYWVDTHVRPEPLRTIFKGIRAAIEAFKQRAVGGDDLCLVFFDQALDWPRVVRLNVEGDNVSLSEKFAYLEQLTDFETAAGFDRIIEHGMFPGYYSDTNVQQALRYAMNEFNKAGSTSQDGIPSADFLVLISDGFANCRNCFSTELAENMICDKRQVDVNCGQTLADHYIAMREIKDLAGILGERRIPLHVLLVGSEQQQPNTMEIFNPSTGRCYTDEEYRSRSLSSGDDPYGFVYGGPSDSVLRTADGTPLTAFSNMNLIQLHNTFNAAVNAPFFYNTPQQVYDRVYRDFYEVAVRTGGLYAPIRQQCCPSGNCQPQPDCSQSTPPRPLRCDKENRNTEDQVTAYLEEIVSFNPYAIVYTN